MNLHVVGIGRIPRVRPRPLAQGSATPAAAAYAGTRRVVFEEGGKARAFAARIVTRAALLAGNRIEGPAIVQQMDTTTVIPPAVRAEVDHCGNLILRL